MQIVTTYTRHGFSGERFDDIFAHGVRYMVFARVTICTQLQVGLGQVSVVGTAMGLMTGYTDELGMRIFAFRFLALGRIVAFRTELCGSLREQAAFVGGVWLMTKIAGVFWSGAMGLEGCNGGHLWLVTLAADFV